MTSTASVLICFAVEDEARRFRKKISPGSPNRILITGIGRRNAAGAIESALKTLTPAFVLSGGFAGGLNPELQIGDIVFEAPRESSLFDALLSSGARLARFHTADQIASTAPSKLDLRRSTNADAVEMESGVIREICRQRSIPSATIRIISDAAHEDLPLDFNRFMTRHQKLDYLKLGWTLARSPGTVGRLWDFRRRINVCAEKLAGALAGACAAFANPNDSANGSGA